MLNKFWSQIIFGGGIIMLLAVSAFAATFSGTLNSTLPTFNRTLAFAQGGACSLSGVGSAVHYKTQQITLAASGNITVSFLTADGATFTPSNGDSFLILYGPSGFNPASPCANAIAANDDADGTTLLSKIVTTTPLTAGNYTIVTTSFDNEPTNFPYTYTGFTNASTGPAVVFDANADFNGDGKTDFTVARATTTPLTEAQAPGLAPILRNPHSKNEDGKLLGNSQTKSENLITPPIYWYTYFTNNGTVGIGQLGDAATDFILTEDFDGDLKDDLVVWTQAPATQANFKILQSSTNTVRVETFGQNGDDPAVVGDYDGDGKADPAVYRCPDIASPAGQCFFYFRGSMNNPGGNITYVPWGFGNDGDFFPNIGDFDGDNKNDFCIQRTSPTQAGQGQFVLLKSNGLGVEYINFGLDTDFIVPGDYDGDGKSDFCLNRRNAPSNGLRTYYVLTRTGAVSQIQYGLANDVLAPGDYDGDGKTDFAIWRPNTDPNQNFFWVRNSSNGAVNLFEWGQCPTGNCDEPVAHWAVH